MIRPTVSCDGPGCEQTRGASNHWFLVWIEEAVYNEPRDLGVPALHVAEWQDDLAKLLPRMKHCCGRECVQKLVERFLNRGSLDETAVAEKRRAN